MKPEYEQLVSIIYANSPDSGEYRLAEAKLRAIIAEEALRAAEAQAAAADAAVVAARDAKDAAALQAQKILMATRWLIGATIGLGIVTCALVFATFQLN